MPRPSDLFFTRKVTLQRPEFVKDSHGGTVETFSDVAAYSGVDAAVNPMSSAERQAFSQRMLTTTHKIYVRESPPWKRTDRLEDDAGRKFRILGVHDLAGRGELYLIEAREMP